MLKSTHFNLYYEPGDDERALRLLRVAEGSYSDLSRRLNAELNTVTTILLYRNFQAFQNTTIADLVDENRYAAFSIPQRHLIVMPNVISDKMVNESLVHELSHLFISAALGRGVFSGQIVEPWFEEGLSEYLSGTIDPIKRMLLDDLRSRIGAGEDDYLLKRYLDGQAVVQYLVELKGESAIPQIFSLIRAGSSFNNAFTSVAGSDFFQLYEKRNQNAGVKKSEDLPPVYQYDDFDSLVSFSISPNGRYKAFLLEGTSSSEVRVVDGVYHSVFSESSSLSGYSVIADGDSKVSWNDASDKICFLLQKNYHYYARIVSLPENSTRDIPLPFSHISRLKLSGDGNSLTAITLISGMKAIIKVSVNSLQSSILYSSLNDINDYCFLGEGLFAAVESEDSYSLLKISAGGNASLLLSGFPVLNMTVSHNQILLTAADETYPGIYTVDLSGNLKKILIPDLYGFSPQRILDRICYLTIENGKTVLREIVYAEERYVSGRNKNEHLRYPLKEINPVKDATPIRIAPFARALGYCEGREYQLAAGAGISNILSDRSLYALAASGNDVNGNDRFSVLGGASFSEGRFSGSLWYLYSDGLLQNDQLGSGSLFLLNRYGFSLSAGGADFSVALTRYFAMDASFLLGKFGDTPNNVGSDALMALLSLRYDSYCGSSHYQNSGVSVLGAGSAEHYDSEIFPTLYSSLEMTGSLTHFGIVLSGDFYHTKNSNLPFSPDYYYTLSSLNSGRFGRIFSSAEAALPVPLFGLNSDGDIPGVFILSPFYRYTSFGDSTAELRKQYCHNVGLSLILDGDEYYQFKLDGLKRYGYREEDSSALVFSAQISL